MAMSLTSFASGNARMSAAEDHLLHSATSVESSLPASAMADFIIDTLRAVGTMIASTSFGWADRAPAQQLAVRAVMAAGTPRT